MVNISKKHNNYIHFGINSLFIFAFFFYIFGLFSGNFVRIISFRRKFTSGLFFTCAIPPPIFKNVKELCTPGIVYLKKGTMYQPIISHGSRYVTDLAEFAINADAFWVETQLIKSQYEYKYMVFKSSSNVGSLIFATRALSKSHRGSQTLEIIKGILILSFIFVIVKNFIQFLVFIPILRYVEIALAFISALFTITGAGMYDNFIRADQKKSTVFDEIKQGEGLKLMIAAGVFCLIGGIADLAVLINTEKDDTNENISLIYIE